jgi:hypothetical protein
MMNSKACEGSCDGLLHICTPRIYLKGMRINIGQDWRFEVFTAMNIQVMVG